MNAKKIPLCKTQSMGSTNSVLKYQESEVCYKCNWFNWRLLLYNPLNLFLIAGKCFILKQNWKNCFAEHLLKISTFEEIKHQILFVSFSRTISLQDLLWWRKYQYKLSENLRNSTRKRQYRQSLPVSMRIFLVFCEINIST